MLDRLRSAAALVLLCLTVSAAAEPPPIKAYGQISGLTFPTLSPSGRRVALIVGVNEKRHLTVIEDLNKILYAGHVGDTKVRNVEWAGDDYVALTVSVTKNLGIDYGGQYELANVLGVHLPDKKARWLLAQDKVFAAVQGIYGFREEGGLWYGYFGALPTSKNVSGSAWIESFQPFLSRVELSSGNISRAYRAIKDGRGWLLNAQSKVLAYQRYDASKRRWSLHSAEPRDLELAAHEDPFGNSDIVGQGRTPQTVLYIAIESQGAARYMEADATGKQPPVEILEDWHVHRFVFHPVTGLLIGAIKSGDEPELVFFDEGLQARVRAIRKALPNLRLRFESWSNDFNQFVVHSEGSGDSGTWWVVDIPKGDAREIGFEYPLVRSRHVGEVRMVQYKAADGMAQEGVLTTPPGIEAKHLPLVVLPHGGPEARDYPHFDWWAQAYASRGYAVWQPNFRGSSGYGLAHRNAGLGEWGRKMQTDISDGVAELARQGIVDPTRACIVGASYGGYAALAGVTVQQKLYRCAVAVAGVSDLARMLRREDMRHESDTTRYWQAFMGAESMRSDVLDQYSPDKLAKQADAPVLLLHGRDDTVVPIHQSRVMYRALKAEKKPVEFLELEGEDHYLSRESTRIQMLEASMAFILEHNPPTL